MKDLLSKFENKQPEIVFNWKDSETEAEGWTVINSLRGGAAGGGTRMRKGLDMNEVLSLAKTMEVKFSVSGPAIGGAKSGINFDPNDPRKKGVLQRWYKAVSPLLKSYYGTGGDLNVDEIHEVIPITEDCGVWHPQEGVFNGHFQPSEADKINRIGQLRHGVIKVLENSKYSPDVSRKYTVADMITGYGVAEAVKHYYDIYGGNVEGKKAIVQGFGNVGYWTSKFMVEDGAILQSVQDAHATLFKEDGIDVADLFEHSKPRKGSIAGFTGAAEIDPEDFFGLDCDILIPAALGNQITGDNAYKIKAKVVAEGANGPTDNEGEKILLEKGVTIIPDILCNSGGVIGSYFEWLQNRNGELWQLEEVMVKLEKKITDAFKKVQKEAEARDTDWRTAAYIIAISRIETAYVQRGIFP